MNNDGATDHSYIPRFNIDGKPRDYAGGFHMQVQDYSFMYPFHAAHLKGFGKQFKQQVRFMQPGFLAMDAYAKGLARPENRVTIDSQRPDAYGIPSSLIRFKFCDNDVAIWKDMKEKAKEILDAAKTRLVVDNDPAPTGFASHEVGTVRMGNDPRTSVLNSHCQAREAPNLFVTDGSCFTTFPEKNPTLTIMALAVRTARYMAEGVRKGDL
jgi:choline dehydrogenase-like flavoprotein